MENKFSNWLGGENFVKQKKWQNGNMNSGDNRRRLGLTKRGRFNPHYGACEGYALAPKNVQAAKDKEDFRVNGMPTKYYKSGLA